MSPRVRLLALHLLLLRGREVRLEPAAKPMRGDRAEKLGHGMRSYEAQITRNSVYFYRVNRKGQRACVRVLPDAHSAA